MGSVPATVYGGGGYVWRLNKGKSELEEDLKMLKEKKWIDQFTRAIIIDFAVYNPQVKKKNEVFFISWQRRSRLF